MDQPNKSRRVLWAALTISLGFNAGFVTVFALRAFDHRRPPHPEPRRESGLGPLHDALNLTSQEQEALRASREKTRQEMEAFRRQAIAEQKRLAELVTASEPDKEAIALQLGKAASVQGQAQERLIEHLLQEKALLLPEHRASFNEFIRNHLLRHLLGGGPPGGGPPAHRPPHGREGPPPHGHHPPPPHGDRPGHPPPIPPR